MRIAGMTATEFMRFGLLEMEFGHLTLVVAPNAQGKSTVRDALEFALTGKARGLKYKKDVAALAHEGSAKMCVELDVPNVDPQLVRTKAGCNWTPARIGAEFGGLDGEQLQLLLDPWWLVGLPAAKRLEIFKKLGGTGEITGKVQALIDKVLPVGHAKALALMVMQDRKKAEQECVHQRRSYKRELEEAEAAEKPTKVAKYVGEFDAYGFDLDQMTATDLAGHRSKAKEKVGELSLLVGQAKLARPAVDVAADKRRLDKAIAMRRKKLKSTIQRITDIDLVTVGAEVNEANKCIKQAGTLTAEWSELVDTLKQLDKEKAGCAGQRKVVESLGKDGRCPLAGIVCPVESEQLTAMLADIDAEVGRIEEQARPVSDRKTWLVGEMARLSGPEGKEALAKADSLRAKLLREQGAMEVELEGHDGELGKLMNERSDVVEEQGLNEGSGAAEEALPRAEEVLKSLEYACEQKNDYAVEKAKWDTAQMRLVTCGKAVDAWDAAQKLVSEGGEVARVFAQGCCWDGLAVTADVLLPGRSLSVGDDGSVMLCGRPVELASRSERYRVGVLLSDYVARSLKCGLLVIDEADVLKGAALKALHLFIGMVSPEYENVFVMATGDPAKAPKSDALERTVYVIEKGEVRKV